MYHRKSDSFIYIVASFMVTFVIVFMAGTTYCRVQNENIVEPIVTKMEKDKAKIIKTTVAVGLSTVSLVIGGVLIIVINFII